MPEAQLILVVEDDQQICAVIVEFLEGRGYRAAVANDLAAGARILRATQPALVISDGALRGSNGSDLATLAREMGVPVLLMSGAPAVIERLGSGPLSFLHKPFRLGDLEREVAKLLGTPPH
jgi:DNA-binding response OmpR family regulator